MLRSRHSARSRGIHVDPATTRSFKPVKIAQSWEIKEGKPKAMKVERYIKKLSRKEKDRIVSVPDLLDLSQI